MPRHRNPVPHSYRGYPTSQPWPNDASWPPPGWTDEGLIHARRQHDRTVRFLAGHGLGRNAVNRSVAVAAARIRELHQFGATPGEAQTALADAYSTLLAIPSMARADTRPLVLPHPTVPDPREEAVP